MLMRPTAIIAITVAMSTVAFAGDLVFTPPTSMVKESHRGLFAHTNHLVYTGPWFGSDDLLVDLGGEATHGPVARFYSTPSGYYPADIRGAYGDTANGGNAIAIVDAYHYPSSLKDFNVFAKQFGLPQETSTNPTATTNKVFQVVYGSGKQPNSDGGWSEEMALDIEWAHAMAPNAKIYLVEASSSSYSALMQAVTKAGGLAGVKQISMSWGGGEFSGESSFDSTFNSVNATYFASAGDTGGAQEYPAESPKVVGVGGTSLTVSHHTYVSEKAWSGSGGGKSSYEGIPSYQSALSSLLGSKRGGPDIAAVADPYTGVAVYDSTPYYGYQGWLVFGGTSVACPVCAGIANAGGLNRGSNELKFIYGHTSGFHDIESGTAGSYSAGPGWDFITGWGTPVSSASL